MIANKKILNKATFIDTWGWLALGHQRDEYHSEVKEIFLEFRNDDIPIFTSDYVLDELITLIFRRENINESIIFINSILSATASDHLRIERITSERFVSAWELRKRYTDKPEISFTDFTSMVIMKENSIQSILTMDRHFAHAGLGFVLVP